MLLTYESPSLVLLPALLDRQNFRSERPPDGTEPVLVLGVPRWQHVPPLKPDVAYPSNDRSRSNAEHLEEGTVRGPADEVVYRKGTFGGV